MKGSVTKRRGDHLPVVLEYVASMWPLTATKSVPTKTCSPGHGGSREALGTGEKQTAPLGWCFGSPQDFQLTLADLEAYIAPVNGVHGRGRESTRHRDSIVLRCDGNYAGSKNDFMLGSYAKKKNHGDTNRKVEARNEQPRMSRRGSRQLGGCGEIMV